MGELLVLAQRAVLLEVFQVEGAGVLKEGRFLVLEPLEK
jgi:hypothetical protein